MIQTKYAQPIFRVRPSHSIRFLDPFPPLFINFGVRPRERFLNPPPAINFVHDQLFLSKFIFLLFRPRLG